MEENLAKSRYFMENGSRHSGDVSGDIVVAYWYTEPDDTLFYYTGGNNVTTLSSLNCTDGDGHQDVKDVYNGDTETAWGSVYSCEKGPSLTDNLREILVSKSDSPPTIVMAGNGEVYLVVEESSTSPSFLYSVWVVGKQSALTTELNHVFHIAATMRLAEAVVTGIVHGDTSGGGCFGLLRSFSESRVSYDNTAQRALPFGECPNGDNTAQIEDTETIEYGLKIGVNALLCIVWLMLLTSIGVAWSICLRSSIGMDIYDRDELIRAVSLQGVAPGGTPSSEIRIFVRREDTGNISVVISDTGKAHGAFARLFKKGGNVVENIEPSPVAASVEQYNHGFGGANIPVGPNTMWLEGVRTGMGRAIPGPNGNFRYPTSVALSASPVPSNAGSLVTTPISSPGRRGNSFVPQGRIGFPAGRGPSVMFESGFSSGNSGDGTPNGVQAVDGGGSATASRGGSGRLFLPSGGQRPTLAVSQATSASDIETPGPSSEGKAPERRGLARGIPHMGGFPQGSESDTEESRYSSDQLEIESPERSPSSEGGGSGMNSYDFQTRAVGNFSLCSITPLKNVGLSCVETQCREFVGNLIFQSFLGAKRKWIREIHLYFLSMFD